MPDNSSTIDAQVSGPVKIHRSPRGKLTLRDYAKGGIMAVNVAVLTTAQQLIANGADQLFTAHTGKTVGLAALGGLVAYLVKNFATDTKTVVE